MGSRAGTAVCVCVFCFFFFSGGGGGGGGVFKGGVEESSGSGFRVLGLGVQGLGFRGLGFRGFKPQLFGSAALSEGRLLHMADP